MPHRVCTFIKYIRHAWNSKSFEWIGAPHSRSQWPRSFWSALSIETSGQSQHRKSAIHGLIVKSDQSDWLKIIEKLICACSKVGTCQRSRFLALTKRIKAYGDENGGSLTSSLKVTVKWTWWRNYAAFLLQLIWCLKSEIEVDISNVMYQSISKESPHPPYSRLAPSRRGFGESHGWAKLEKIKVDYIREYKNKLGRKAVHVLDTPKQCEQGNPQNVQFQKISLCTSQCKPLPPLPTPGIRPGLGICQFLSDSEMSPLCGGISHCLNLRPLLDHFLKGFKS